MGSDLISDFERIEQICKYKVGNLYMSKPPINPIFFEKEEDAIFDMESWNFHLYPQDKSLWGELEKKSGELRKNVIDKLKEYEGVVFTKTIDEFSKFAKSNINKIGICDGAGKSGMLKKSQGNHLFKYILACKHNILYELNFMRFYISIDRKVNCIFNCIQFDRAIGSGDITKRYVNKNNGICYPTAYLNQSLTTLQKIIETNKEKSFCYNPPCDFEDVEVIARLFIQFINECDEYKNNRKS